MYNVTYISKFEKWHEFNIRKIIHKNNLSLFFSSSFLSFSLYLLSTKIKHSNKHWTGGNLQIKQRVVVMCKNKQKTRRGYLAISHFSKNNQHYTVKMPLFGYNSKNKKPIYRTGRWNSFISQQHLSNYFTCFCFAWLVCLSGFVCLFVFVFISTHKVNFGWNSSLDKKIQTL